MVQAVLHRGEYTGQPGILPTLERGMRRINAQLLDYLTKWGDWREAGVPGLSYPSSTAEYRYFYEPGRAGRNSGPIYERHPIEQSVEVAIKAIEHELQLVLWFRYAGKIDRLKCAKAFSCTVNQWDWKVEKAHKKAAQALNIPLYR